MQYIITRRTYFPASNYSGLHAHVYFTIIGTLNADLNPYLDYVPNNFIARKGKIIFLILSFFCDFVIATSYEKVYEANRLLTVNLSVFNFSKELAICNCF